ncbi:GNAT family N-acetyltransferase [Xenorhabdus thuongxuanensis]|uniref:GNAT family acetyltransferase n=1 Tax=Xenorhabdus thuongxuanensis TaxID=1873484 RepID=A0A1Q5U167_9GAMM|nr:GNAT family N-acetyltransferase [Xenorhabdus thuongxuanensis]OKP06181.1 GNAT family acetyltransferase [Xenorhabdus thuongxuanensis]
MKKHQLSAAIWCHHQIEDYFFSSISQMSQHISESVRAYVTGVETHSLNFLLVIDVNEQTAGDLQKGIRLLEEKTYVPFAIVAVEPDSQLLEVIQQAGFVLDADSITIAMQLDLMHWQMSNVSVMEYDIRCVDHCLDDWAIPVESAFESDDAISGQYQKCHQAALNAGKNLQHYALYIDELPVCSLTLSRLNNLVRLDEISTVVEKQRRGYAFALINHVLNKAKQDGATTCYLDASRYGDGLYRRIGFQPLFEYQGFSRK